MKMMKQAALDVMESQKPVNVLFGTVTNINPLQITIDQKLILEANQLIMTRMVKDHTIEMTVDHATENTSGGSDYGTFESHNHAYKGRKTFTVHNGLIVGEKVILIRMQGGQRYVVVDRLA